MPVIVSNFNYFYHRGTDEEQKELKYHTQHPAASTSDSTPSLNEDGTERKRGSSAGSLKNRSQNGDLEDSVGGTSYQNMMVGNHELDSSDLYNSPIIPSPLTNLIDTWSSNLTQSPERSPSHKQFNVSKSTTKLKPTNANVIKSNSINLNSNNIETNV